MGPIDRCCGSACAWGRPDSPCWGDVGVVAEMDYGDDHSWVHACEGHCESWEGGPYHPPPPDCDTVREDDEELHDLELAEAYRERMARATADDPPVWHGYRTPPPAPGWYLVIWRKWGESYEVDAMEWDGERWWGSRLKFPEAWAEPAAAEEPCVRMMADA